MEHRTQVKPQSLIAAFAQWIAGGERQERKNDEARNSGAELDTVLSVRKRLVIGAIAAVAIGVAAYMLSQPKKGTVEWHKAKFNTCFSRMWGGTLWQRTVRLTQQAIGIPLSPIPNPAAETKARAHIAALVALGYLAERRYIITNTSLNNVLARTYQRRRMFGKTYMPPDLMERIDQGQLVVIALPDVASQYDDLIREADVPESE